MALDHTLAVPGGAASISALVKELADLLTEAGLTELECGSHDQRLRLYRRPAAPRPQALPAPGPVPLVATASLTVTSMQVGWARLSPPGLANPPRPGDRVRQGQAVMAVEMITVPHIVRAPRDGLLAGCFVGDGEPVEFGQPLFALE